LATGMEDRERRADAASAEDRDFADFVEMVRRLTSIDLSQYKEHQMRRRLNTLRLRHGFASFADYFQALTRDEKLLAEFLDRVTINVSEFWRNAVRWETLRDRFLPELLKRSPRLKAWSAACSTGEEPYTLAMILDGMGVLDRASILATDIDEGALAKARRGLYPERSLREVPTQLIPRYFTRENGMYLVLERLRRAVRFEKHNLLLDPFGEGYDLIICRNVIIYFTEDAKKTLYQKLARALRPGGILFVGSTEQIFYPERYGLKSVETFFYRRTE